MNKGRSSMQIQLNTDHNLTGSDDLATRVEAVVADAVDRFADRITRVEVHLNDVNAGKAGPHDKRCMLEARVAGRAPVAVTHTADSLDLALAGAADKLAKALDRALGRVAAAQSAPSTGEVAADPGLLDGAREVLS
jgi:ribosome-associated translation inhibitor RaiA